jgi:hypothetical protein
MWLRHAIFMAAHFCFPVWLGAVPSISRLLRIPSPQAALPLLDLRLVTTNIMESNNHLIYVTKAC